MQMNVLIADDHPIVRSSLAQLLRVVDEDAEVFEASSFEEAIECADKRDDLDLMLVDLRMPGMPPFDGLKQLVTRRPSVPVVIVSAVDNRADALRAIELGAMGYLPKTMAADEFESLLQRVIDGQVAMPRSLLERELPASPGLSTMNDSSSRERLERLTRRQTQVLGYLAQGKSNMQIAIDLGLSEKTVRLHVSAILKTLNLSNRTQAALFAAANMPGEPTESV